MQEKKAFQLLKHFTIIWEETRQFHSAQPEDRRLITNFLYYHIKKSYFKENKLDWVFSIQGHSQGKAGNLIMCPNKGPKQPKCKIFLMPNADSFCYI